MKITKLKSESGLVKLMNKRKAWAQPPHQPPKFDEQYERRAVQAARTHAVANNSDPFAYGRAMLHLRQGYEYPSDMQKDADRAIGIRRAIPRKTQEKKI